MNWGNCLNWRNTPTGLVVRLYVILAALPLVFTWDRSRVAFATAAVIVAVVTVVFVFGWVELRQHVKRYPIYRKPDEPNREVQP